MYEGNSFLEQFCMCILHILCIILSQKAMFSVICILCDTVNLRGQIIHICQTNKHILHFQKCQCFSAEEHCFKTYKSQGHIIFIWKIIICLSRGYPLSNCACQQNYNCRNILYISGKMDLRKVKNEEKLNLCRKYYQGNRFCSFLQIQLCN